MIKIIVRGKDFASFVCQQLVKLWQKNYLVMALPTGKTPLGIYQQLIKQKIEWKKIKIFMLDVFYPQDPKVPDSYQTYIQNNLLQYIDLPPDNFHILNSAAEDPEKECQDYEKKIAQAGGLDLAVLGIGVNGHIAFNEPGTRPESLTHQARLINQPYPYGLTMGIKTILSAKKIILLAKGKNKAKAIKQTLESMPSLDCPASWLQQHQDVVFILEPGAASLLTNRL